MGEQAAGQPWKLFGGDNVSPMNYTKVGGTCLCGLPSKIHPATMGNTSQHPHNIKSEAKVKEGEAGFKCPPRVKRRLGR